MLDIDYADGDSDMEEIFIDPTNGELDFSLKKPVVVKVEKRLKKRRKKPLHKTKFPCEHCGKTFVGKGNLGSHIKRIHLQLKDYKCKICQKAFNTASALESHMLAVHTRRCETCQEYVIESEPWSEGITMKTKRQVSCQCGEVVDVYCLFGRKRVYEDDSEGGKEKRRYNDNTRFACEDCGKLFTSRSHCLRHARKHTQAKDIACQYCPETFRYENSLKKHLQNEHRMFHSATCLVCKMKFENVLDLKKHHRKSHSSKSSSIKAEDKFVKLITKDVTQQNVKVLPANPTATPSFKAKSVKTPAREEKSSPSVAGTSDQEVTEHIELGAGLQKFLGTSPTSGEPEVAFRNVSGQPLDKDTYEIVQQALQGNQFFTEDGNTIIIRTVPQ